MLVPNTNTRLTYWQRREPHLLRTPLFNPLPRRADDELGTLAGTP